MSAFVAANGVVVAGVLSWLAWAPFTRALRRLRGAHEKDDADAPHSTYDGDVEGWGGDDGSGASNGSWGEAPGMRRRGTPGEGSLLLGDLPVPFRPAYGAPPPLAPPPLLSPSPGPEPAHYGAATQPQPHAAPLPRPGQVLSANTTVAPPLQQQASPMNPNNYQRAPRKEEDFTAYPAGGHAIEGQRIPVPQPVPYPCNANAHAYPTPIPQAPPQPVMMPPPPPPPHYQLPPPQLPSPPHLPPPAAQVLPPQFAQPLRPPPPQQFPPPPMPPPPPPYVRPQVPPPQLAQAHAQPRNTPLQPLPENPTGSAAAAEATPTSIAFEDLTLGNLVGGGSFGQVFKATWLGTPVAVKLLKSSSPSSSSAPGAVSDNGGVDAAGPDARALAEFASEVAMLARLRHPNVCLFLGCCLQPPSCYAIVTELVPRGSLWDVLREPRLNPVMDNESTSINKSAEDLPSRRRRRLLGLLPPPYCALPLPLSETSSPDAWCWARLSKVAHGIACGMAYLHGIKPSAVLHRDLKSSNLLCDEAYQVKICDFGMSRLKATLSAAANKHTGSGGGSEFNRRNTAIASTRLELAAMTGNCGTVQWMAPEVLSADKYSETADVFSFGIILWELLCRQCPYEGMSQVQVALSVAQHALRPPWPSAAAAADGIGGECSGGGSSGSGGIASTPTAHSPAYSRAFRVLVEACWHQDPKMRPSFKTLLAPPSLHYLTLAGDQHASLRRDPSISWLEYACAPPSPPAVSPAAIDVNPPRGAVTVMAAQPI